MFLTTRQKEVLNAQTLSKRAIKIPEYRLNVKKSTINSINTQVFSDFMEALEIMADDEYWEIFEGRFKKHYENVWDNIRIIRGKMQKIER